MLRVSPRFCAMSGAPTEMKPVRVRFLPDERELLVPKGTTVLEAARTLGIGITSVCGGQGICGRCRVLIREGRVEAGPTPLLSPEELKAGYVLACQTKLLEDTVVEIPPAAREETSAAVDLDAQGFLALEKEKSSPFSLNPLVQKLFLPLPPPSLEDNLGDQERVFREIRRKIPVNSIQAGLKVLRGLPQILRERGFQITATVAKRGGTTELLQLEPGDRAKESFGVAVDVGTSTVVAHLLHLPTGRTLDAEARYNSQRALGEEVTRRIIAAEREGVERLQALVVEDINALISLMVARQGVKLADVVAVLCAGNTTMTHLLLGLPPGTIRKHPYVAAALRPPPIRAAEVGIRINPRGLLYTVPGIGGWVGGDITAGILAAGVHLARQPVVLVDIGTNGEIVLGCRDWLVACSTSAGPAFEGAGVSCGMRASRGAISRIVFTSDGLRYETIGNEKPRGLCGTGLIDAVAGMLRMGYLDRAGRLQPNGKLLEKSGESAFLLVPQGQGEHDIFVTQRDIENVLRAKAAIYAGLAILLRETGVSLADIAWLGIAGAFGNRLDSENVLLLGLIPDVPLEKVRFLGNTSLQGAKLMLLSAQAMEEAQQIAEHVTYFDLISFPYYYEEFLAAKFLPHTDLSRFPSVRRILEGK